MSTDTSEEFIRLVDCPEIQLAMLANAIHDEHGNCTNYSTVPSGEGDGIIYLPDIRWFQEHIPEFEDYRIEFLFGANGGWWMYYQRQIMGYEEQSVTGTSWEICFAKMYLKEVHGKGE